MKDILVVVADGFEDAELITTLDILSREEISLDIVSVENKDKASGMFYASVDCKKLSDVNSQDYKAIFLPGGNGHKIMLESKELKEILIKYKNENKIISAICAAPEVLLQAGVIDGIKITSYEGYGENGYNNHEEFVVTDTFVTGRDYLATPNFAKALAKEIKK